ncbi:SGNH/GDSL hydrolase family protein [Patulibacter defluvii]|uniref:SGNH/GDSL hydrolase family protein n=1 Tax=Patulibacter defluvii TaxID=3095358 RepID=UPI002A76526A|nr:SGNH/GDSL hydrolase family protein [Patulibacter sp. DM4]
MSAALAAGLGAVAGAAPPAVAGPVWDRGAGERYVAMGDSAAAGPLAGVPRADPIGCFRSLDDFATGVATRLAVAAFDDRTCDGAALRHLSEPQSVKFEGRNPPQLDGLDARTTLVTLGPIGANDTGLVGMVTECLNFFPPPTGRSCAARFRASGEHGKRMARIDALGPRLDVALGRIRARAPHARVFVVGYGRYLVPGGCFPAQPVLPEDGDYIQAAIDRMNGVLRRSAAAAGAVYVDLQTPESREHTACAPLGQRWLEGLITDDLGSPVPFHPSRLGMAAFGRIVADAIRAAPSRQQAPAPQATGPAVARVERLALAPARFRAGHGTRVRLWLSQPGAVRFVVRRRGRLRSVGRFVVRRPAGASSVRWSGRVGGRRLAAGRYRLTAAPLGAPDGSGRTVRFRILAR